MSDRMTVHRDGKPIYDIVMEENYDRLGQEVASLSVRERRLCVVTDSTVAELYSDIVIRQLEPVCKEVNLFVFPAGEENKNLDTSVALPRQPTCAAFVLFRYLPLCFPRWIPASAVRPA